MGDSYAVVVISKIEIFVPEPMIPSWDLIYNGLEGDTGRDGVKELHTGASFQKGATVKITDQEWSQRVVLLAHSKSALQRKITFHLMKQSKLTSKRRIAMELEFDLNSLVQAHKPQVIVHELFDSKGGKVIIKLSCESTAPSLWWDEIRHSMKNSKNRLEKFNSLISQLHELFTLPTLRSKLISYLNYKKNAASTLCNLFETYMNTILENQTLANNIRAAPTTNSPLFADMTPKQIRKRKAQAKVDLEVINGYQTQLTELIAQLLKETLARKIFLDAEYLQTVITWACKPNLSVLATAALGSLKPLFASDALQELLGRAGIIHFLIHILNPTTEYGRAVSEDVVGASMQILPYFSNRFHAIFVKADFFPCVEALLKSSVNTHFLRGIELLMILSATRADEVIHRLLPAFESSLADIAGSMKEIRTEITQLSARVEQDTSFSSAALSDIDSLLQACAAELHKYASADKSSAAPLELKKPIILNRGFTGQHIRASIPNPPPLPPPVAPRVLIRKISPPPVVRKIPARERNEAEIRELSRQVGRLLEDPGASPTEVARILDEIEQLGTDTPEPSPRPTEPPPEPEPEPVADILDTTESDALNLLITADVGLRIESWKLDYKNQAESLANEDKAKKDDHDKTSDTTTYQAPITVETNDTNVKETEMDESATMKHVEAENKKDEEIEEHPASAALKLLAQVTSSLDEPISPRHDANMQSSAPTNDSDEEDDPVTPMGVDNGLRDSRSMLKRSMNRLTQEISTLEVIASSIDENSKTGKSSLRSSATSENADTRRINQRLITLLYPDENPEAKEVEENPEIDPQIEAETVEWGRLLAELDGMLERASPDELEALQLDISSPSDSDELVTRNRSYSGSSSSSSDSHFIGEDNLRAIDRAVGEDENTSSAPAPAPREIAVPKLESGKLLNLRVKMTELERSVTKLLHPIVSLSSGHESLFGASMILNHLVTIMSTCSTAQLKGVLLELITKISAGSNACEMKPGFVEAVLSHALTLLSEKPQYSPHPLPPAMAYVKSVLSAPNFNPNASQMVLILQLLKIPQGRWRNLDQALLSLMRSWDLFSLSYEYPPLLHAIARSFNQERVLVTDALKRAISIPDHDLSPHPTDLNNTDFDTSLNGSSNHHQKSQAMILTRLIRDHEFMNNLFGSVMPSNMSDIFFPILDAVMSQKSKVNRAEIAAFDATAMQRALGLTQDKQDHDKSHTPVSKSMRSRTHSSGGKATPSGKPSARGEKSSPTEKSSPNQTACSSEKISTNEKPTSLTLAPTRAKNRKSRLLSSSSKSSSSSGLSSPRATPSVDEEFTLLQLLEGAVSKWESSKPRPTVLRSADLQSMSICRFIVRKASVAWDHDSLKETILSLGMLTQLPYLNDFAIFAPEEMVSLIQCKRTDGHWFKEATNLFLGLSSEAIARICKHEFGSAYLTRLLLVRETTSHIWPSETELLTRLCLEGNFWNNILGTSNLNDAVRPGSIQKIVELSEKHPQLYLELLKFLPNEQTEFLPPYLFESILQAIHELKCGNFIMVDMMRALHSIPSFWQHVAIYASKCQTLLIRIYYGDKRGRYPSEFRDWAIELLESKRCAAMTKDGFLVNCFETLSAQDPSSLPTFVLQLLSIEKARNYQCLKLSVRSEAARRPPMPKSVRDLLKVVFNQADLSVEGLRPEEIDILDISQASDWKPIFKNSPVAIVAYEADFPDRAFAGGVIPQLEHFFDHFPYSLSTPPPLFGSVRSGLFCVTGAVLTFHNRDTPPEIISRTHASLGHAGTPKVNFGDEVMAFKLDESPQVTFKPALPSPKIGRIAIYKFVDPLIAPQGLSSLPTIAALAIRYNLSFLTSIGLAMQAISSSDPQGTQIISSTCSAILKAFEGTEFADKANQFVIQTTSPGFAVSTLWNPILGTNTIGNGPQAATIRAEGCFAAMSEPLQGKQIVLWDSKPTVNELPPVEVFGESPFDEIPSSITNEPVIAPTFIHFVLSAVTRNATQATPKGAIVFMSSDPIPTATLLSVPCRNVSEARKAKWPLPPTSVIEFTESVPTGSGQNMVKSALVTIARPLQAHFVLVMGLGSEGEGESSTSSQSPTVATSSNLEPVIFSMVLLGTTVLPVKVPDYERLAYFFKSASVSTSCFIAPNNQLKGIIHFIGTELGQKAWQNPAEEGGDIVVKLSHPLFRPGIMNSTSVVGRDLVQTYWGSSLPVWFCIDLIDFRACPTHFALRHGYEQANSFIQNWKLEASHDKHSWTTLFQQTDKSHTQAYECILYKLDETPKEYYRYWRVITESNYWLGPNLKGNPMMCCSGFDLFGSLSKPPAEHK